MRREVDQAAAHTEPSTVWNAFIDLIATEEYEALSPVQKGAHLVYWYESEVQNGGHHQFFVNGGTVNLPETIGALGDFGLRCQAEILARAGETWLSSERTFPETGEELASDALEGEFDEHDAAFHTCEPSLVEALETHLKDHRDEYVVLV